MIASTNHKVNKVFKNQTGRIHPDLGSRFMFPSVAPKIRLLTTRAFPAESLRFSERLMEYARSRGRVVILMVSSKIASKFRIAERTPRW
jgi:hypothetical protein